MFLTSRYGMSFYKGYCHARFTLLAKSLPEHRKTFFCLKIAAFQYTTVAVLAITEARFFSRQNFCLYGRNAEIYGEDNGHPGKERTSATHRQV